MPEAKQIELKSKGLRMFILLSSHSVLKNQKKIKLLSEEKI